ncbi:MAG: hypothetical protein ACLPN5_06795 [Roseiarcus sp.]
MLSRKSTRGSLAALVAAGAMLLSATVSQAAMAPAPAPSYAGSDIQLAFCVVGAHIGPVGACIGQFHRYHRYHHCWINRWGHRVCNW